MKEKDIPERCRTCEYMKRWTLPVNGEPEYSCMGGRIPEREYYCNRHRPLKTDASDGGEEKATRERRNQNEQNDSN